MNVGRDCNHVVDLSFSLSPTSQALELCVIGDLAGEGCKHFCWRPSWQFHDNQRGKDLK